MRNITGEARENLEVTSSNEPYMAIFRPSHKNHPSKMNKTCGTMLEIQGQTHK